jgi:ankyrin repeat protein
MTPLHIATLRKNLDFVDLLLEYGADMVVNADGDTPLSICRFYDTGEAAYVLYDLNIESHWATITGLRAAACKGRDVRIRQLLERGADVNARDEGGMTALLWAANKKSLSTIKLLVENGADVNVKSDWDSTPMSYVCDEPELRAYLLANGYNMDPTGTAEDDPPEYSKKDLPPEEDYVLDEIKRLLEERMNEPLTEDEDTIFTGSGSEGPDEV